MRKDFMLALLVSFAWTFSSCTNAVAKSSDNQQFTEYGVIEGNSTDQLATKVNTAMTIRGWKLVGGVCKSGNTYCQVMAK